MQVCTQDLIPTTARSFVVEFFGSYGWGFEDVYKVQAKLELNYKPSAP